MKTSVNTILIVLFSCLSAIAQKAEVKVEPNQILIGEQANLSIHLSVSATDSIQWPDISEYLNDAIEILSTGKIDSSFNKDDILIRELSQQFTITSFDTGFFPIPTFAFLGKEDTIFSDGQVFYVSTVALDSTSQLADIYGPIGVPYTFSEFMKDYGWYILIGILVALLAWYIITNRKKWKPEVKSISEPEIPKEPAHVIALRKLHEIENKRSWNDSVKVYYSDLSEILRAYLENRFNVLALEQTTDEILAGLIHRISGDVKTDLEQILKQTDLVKFAKFQPDAAGHEPLLKLCIQFVETTGKKEIKEGEDEGDYIS